MPDRSYCAKLKRGAAAVSKYYDRQMADSGITISQYGDLRNVSRGPKRAPSRELADLSEQDKSTMARMVKPLMARADPRKNLQKHRNKPHPLDARRESGAARATACWQRSAAAGGGGAGEKERIVQMEAMLKALEAL